MEISAKSAVVEILTKPIFMSKTHSKGGHDITKNRPIHQADTTTHPTPGNPTYTANMTRIRETVTPNRFQKWTEYPQQNGEAT